MAAARDSLLKAHIWLYAGLLPLVVRLVPLKALLWLVRPAKWRGFYRGVPWERIVQIVEERLANPWNMRRRVCLRKSLTLYHFLLLAGWPARLHFGVYPPALTSGRLLGHCWVSLEGKPLCTPADGPVAQVLSESRA